LTPIPSISAAWRLEGKTLDGGWRVVKQVQQDLDATGGHFSVGYLVEHDDGRKGFLKALDYAKAFSGKGKPVSIALQELTESINFEKYVLSRCRDRRLDRIVISIADGTYVDGQPGIDTVEYLIFELADGDVRKHMKVVDKLDVIWRVKTLHHIATGLNQLHTNDIFHQDIKPSNILVFTRDLSKIADVGRSACPGQSPPHFLSLFAGDWTYAPPDVLYQFALPDPTMRALSFDAYLLGSMVVYFFTSHATTPLLLSELHPTYADWKHYAAVRMTSNCTSKTRSDASSTNSRATFQNVCALSSSTSSDSSASPIPRTAGTRTSAGARSLNFPSNGTGRNLISSSSGPKLA
jgi:serine/threonine protein kinase